MSNAFLIIPVIYLLNVNYLNSQWVIQPLPAASGKSLSMDYSDKDHGIVCGGFTDFDSHARTSYTTNRGVNWYPASIPDSAKFFYSVKFVDLKTAFMGGTYQPGVNLSTENLNGSGWKAFFLKTVNYGKDWRSIVSKDLEPYNNLEAIDFINDEKGIAIANNYESQDGNTDNIIITADSGNSWGVVFSLNDSLFADLVSIQYVSDDFICAAGNYIKNKSYTGAFMRTADGGLHWDKVLIVDLMINNITFSDRFSGFLLGTSSVNSLSMLYKTSNGGMTWELIQTFTDNYYNGVTFLNESGCGLLYGFRRFYENPALSISNDFGNSWRNQSVPPTTDLVFADAVILTPEEMNITGGEVFSGSIVMHTTNGGWTYISSSSGYNDEKYFYLYQNYPNPFNPFTVINYDLKLKIYLTLKLYNVSGIEIETLIDENQDKGFHSVTFDGSNLSSGIYFYRLETNSFTETKKMILIR